MKNHSFVYIATIAILAALASGQMYIRTDSLKLRTEITDGSNTANARSLNELSSSATDLSHFTQEPFDGPTDPDFDYTVADLSTLEDIKKQHELAQGSNVPSSILIFKANTPAIFSKRLSSNTERPESPVVRAPLPSEQQVSPYLNQPELCSGDSHDSTQTWEPMDLFNPAEALDTNDASDMPASNIFLLDYQLEGGGNIPSHSTVLAMDPENQLSDLSAEHNVWHAASGDKLPPNFETTLRSIISEIGLATDQATSTARNDFAYTLRPDVVVISPLRKYPLTAIQGHNVGGCPDQCRDVCSIPQSAVSRSALEQQLANLSSKEAKLLNSSDANSQFTITKIETNIRSITTLSIESNPASEQIQRINGGKQSLSGIDPSLPLEISGPNCDLNNEGAMIHNALFERIDPVTSLGILDSDNNVPQLGCNLIPSKTSSLIESPRQIDDRANENPSSPAFLESCCHLTGAESDNFNRHSVSNRNKSTVCSRPVFSDFTMQPRKVARDENRSCQLAFRTYGSALFHILHQVADLSWRRPVASVTSKLHSLGQSFEAMMYGPIASGAAERFRNSVD